MLALLALLSDPMSDPAAIVTTLTPPHALTLSSANCLTRWRHLHLLSVSTRSLAVLIRRILYVCSARRRRDACWKLKTIERHIHLGYALRGVVSWATISKWANCPGEMSARSGCRSLLLSLCLMLSACWWHFLFWIEFINSLCLEHCVCYCCGLWCDFRAYFSVVVCSSSDQQQKYNVAKRRRAMCEQLLLLCEWERGCAQAV